MKQPQKPDFQIQGTLKKIEYNKISILKNDLKIKFSYHTWVSESRNKLSISYILLCLYNFQFHARFLNFLHIPRF